MKILFRAKPIDTNIWIHGDLIHSITAKCYIKYGEKKGDSITEVIEKTIGQYTGLNDQNETFIFNGDIVNFGGGAYFEVRFTNGYFSLSGGEPLGYDIDKLAPTDMRMCRVVGNIHDNPDIKIQT
jgi:hypothetical protein